MKESKEQRESKRRIFCEIVDHMLRDKDKGMAAFYNHYGKFIIAVTRSICRSEDKVSEATNETLVKVWTARYKLHDVKNPEAWIYVVAANCAKDLMKPEKALPLNENIVTGNDGIKEFFEECYFMDMIKNLNRVERKIMIMKFTASCTFYDIGAAMLLPAPTVSSIYYRAIKKLQKEHADESYFVEKF